MARSQETYNKKEVHNRKEKKRKEKLQKKMDRRTSPRSGGEDMIAYVDENGRITSERPEPGIKKSVKAEDIEISTPRQTSSVAESKTRTGIINFFNDSKGYGFIRDLENNQNIFVHINDMEEKLSENTRVNFEVERGNRGIKAIKVKLAKT
jgi:cold shock CspA family protein